MLTLPEKNIMLCGHIVSECENQKLYKAECVTNPEYSQVESNPSRLFS